MERETHLAMLRARATHVASPLVASASKDGGAQLDALRANGLAHRLAAPVPEPEPEPRGFAKRECAPLSPELRAKCDAAADRLSQRVAAGEHHRRRAAAAVTVEQEAVRRARAAQLPEEWRRAEATYARERDDLAERRAAESAAIESRRQHTAERLAHDRAVRQEAARRQLDAQEQLNTNQLTARAHSFNAAAADADAAATRLRARIARQADARNTVKARPARSGPPPQRSELAALEAGEREDLIYTLTREELMELMGEERVYTDTGSDTDDGKECVNGGSEA
jgi:hypothetical protein